jgi:hypothetical protein
MFAKSGRLLVAVALAATFFLALPAQATEGRSSSPGFWDCLVSWIADSWDGWTRNSAVATAGVTSVDHDGGHLDPNGGPRTGACTAGQPGCGDAPPSAGSAGQP